MAHHPRTPDRPSPGIRRHGSGYQTVAKVRGERHFAQWPLDTPLREMQEWQKDERAKMRSALPTVKAGTFAADAARYLELAAVKAMPTYGTRKQHIDEWVALFGTRRRRSITALEIEEQREHLRATYAASSVNHRLRALSNLWTKLDGRQAPNPVREVAECEEPDVEARGLPYDVIEAILAAIPDTWIGKQKDGTKTAGKPRPSKTKARLRVIAYTGLSHKQLKGLGPTDVTIAPPDADGQQTGTLRLVARHKGRRMRRAGDRPLPRLLPLLPQAVAAFQEFDRLQCWGNFSNSSMRKAFINACATLGLTNLRPYDFRHSLLTAIYAETRDLRVTGLFGGHREEKTTKRYTVAAVAPHVQAAVTVLGKRLLASTLASSAPATIANIDGNRTPRDGTISATDEIGGSVSD